MAAPYIFYNKSLDTLYYIQKRKIETTTEKVSDEDAAFDKTALKAILGEADLARLSEHADEEACPYRVHPVDIFLSTLRDYDQDTVVGIKFDRAHCLVKAHLGVCGFPAEIPMLKLLEHAKGFREFLGPLDEKLYEEAWRFCTEAQPVPVEVISQTFK